MNATLHHIALCYTTHEDAVIFFSKVFGFKYVRGFQLSSSLSKKIFNISRVVDVDVFENENMRFELFYAKMVIGDVYSHVCIEVEDKKDLVKKCQQYNILSYFVKKNDKELLFVRDHNKNLYEIKMRC